MYETVKLKRRNLENIRMYYVVHDCVTNGPQFSVAPERGAPQAAKLGERRLLCSGYVLRIETRTFAEMT